MLSPATDKCADQILPIDDHHDLASLLKHRRERERCQPRNARERALGQRHIGKEIETLVSEKQLPGKYEIRWNPVGLPSNVHVYQLQAGEFVAAKRLILLK